MIEIRDDVFEGGHPPKEFNICSGVREGVCGKKVVSVLCLFGNSE